MCIALGSKLFFVQSSVKLASLRAYENRLVAAYFSGDRNGLCW